MSRVQRQATDRNEPRMIGKDVSAILLMQGPGGVVSLRCGRGRFMPLQSSQLNDSTGYDGAHVSSFACAENRTSAIITKSKNWAKLRIQADALIGRHP